MTRALAPELRALVQRLDVVPGIERSQVFGSTLERPETAMDLDLVFVVPGPANRLSLIPPLGVLRLASWGTPHYGRLDVFVRFEDRLYVRNATSDDFEVAKNARTLRRAMDQQAQPWGVWRATLDLEMGVPPASVPRAPKPF